jgi:glucosamine--fructose-6-phosphate aminotransferase (isomerizing)
MCGIVAIVGREAVAQRLFEGLRRLEYRGYDSAGICTIAGGRIRAPPGRGQARQSRRASWPPRRSAARSGSRTPAGRRMARRRSTMPIRTSSARWRWSTMASSRISSRCATSCSPTGASSVGDRQRSRRAPGRARGRARRAPADAVATVLPRLHGAFAIAFLFEDHPDLVIGARMGAPLTVGYGEGENYLGSDALALAPLTQRIAYLDEGDWVVVERDAVQIFDRDNQPVEREIVTSGASSAKIDKGNHAHFMRKEIFEQPIVVAQTLQSYVRPFEGEVALPLLDFDLASIQRVTIVACGTSYLCRDGRQILVRAVRARAGRHRCRERVPLPPAGARAGRAGAVHFAVGRDRRHARRAAPCARARARTIAVVVNVPTSSMAREADLLLPTLPGPRSASPRPRRSPASWRCSPRSPPTSRAPRAN